MYLLICAEGFFTFYPMAHYVKGNKDSVTIYSEGDTPVFTTTDKTAIRDLLSFLQRLADRGMDFLEKMENGFE